MSFGVSTPKQRLRYWWFPAAVLVIGLVLTALAAISFAESNDARAQRRFDAAIMEAQERIHARLQSYIALLRGGGALFAVKPDVTRNDWRDFVDRLRVQEFYPGVQGIGFTLRLTAEETNAVIMRARQDGLTNFTLRPADPRPEYHTIVYLEPLDRRNLAAIGYDMFSEPIRRAAMERAWLTGEPAASGKVRLVQEIEGPEQAGFLIYLPVYREGNVPDDLEERRRALIGFVYSPFRADDLFHGIFGNRNPLRLSLEVYDGVNVTPDQRLHSSLVAPKSGTAPHRPRYRASSQLEVAGQTWTLVFSSTPTFEANTAYKVGPTIGVFGVLVSLAMFYLARRETASRQAAEAGAQQLAEQSERLRVTLGSIGDAVIATDRQGRVELMNAAAERLTGWKESAALGKPLQEVFIIINEANRQPVENPVERVLREGAIVGLAHHTLLVSRDGTHRNIDDRAAPIRDRSGLTIGVVLVFQDVTERRRDERRLATQHDVTRILSEAPSLAEAVPAILESFCRNLRWDAGRFWELDARAQKLRCVHGWCEADPICREFIEASRGREVSRGETLAGRLWQNPREVAVHDLASETGPHLLPPARAMGLRSVVAFPILIGAEVVGVMELFSRAAKDENEVYRNTKAAIGSQIAQFIERKQAETDLRRSQAHFKLLFDFNLIGFYFGTSDGQIIEANDAFLRLLGFSRDELREGELRWDRLASSDREQVEQMVSQFTADGFFGPVETEYLHKNGSRVPVLAGAAKLPDEPWGITFVLDLTRQKQTETALKQARAELASYAADLERKVADRTARLSETIGELEAFSYSISHDLRAPLRAMNAFAGILLNDHAGTLDEEAKTYLDRIYSASMRMDRLITDVLTYSRVARTDLKLETINLERLIDDILHQYPALQPPNADVEIVRPLLPVRGEQASLTQSLSNLMTNGAKFVPRGVKPEIRVWTEPRDGEVRIWIQDNGIGIQRKDQERIFGMFERIHPDREYEGTGIGLAVVKKAVQRMGGAIGVESEWGRGSKFWIQLRQG